MTKEGAEGLSRDPGHASLLSRPDGYDLGRLIAGIPYAIASFLPTLRECGVQALCFAVQSSPIGQLLVIQHQALDGARAENGVSKPVD